MAERHQDGAAILRRIRAMSNVRLDIPFRPFRIRGALIDEITIKDVRRLGRALVQMPCNLAPRLHSQEGHCWAQGLITVQHLKCHFPFWCWELCRYRLGLCSFDCLRKTYGTLLWFRLYRSGRCSQDSQKERRRQCCISDNDTGMNVALARRPAVSVTTICESLFTRRQSPAVRTRTEVGDRCVRLNAQ